MRSLKTIRLAFHETVAVRGIAAIGGIAGVYAVAATRIT